MEKSEAKNGTVFLNCENIFFSRSSTGPQEVRCAGKNGPQTAGDFPSTIWRNQGPKTELFFSTAKIFFSAGPAPDHNRSDAPKDSPQTAEDFSLYHMEKSMAKNGTIFFGGENNF